jgi:O-antigen/teichoic acid export membrane protein
VADSLRNKSKKAFAWSAVENILLQVINFVVMIFMARVLTPADYGLVGMITIFTAISTTFVNSGFSQALIRKQDRTEADLSSVFYFNTVVAIFFYLLLFFCAPLIADFYNEPQLISVTRVSALSLIIGGFTAVQGTLFSARLDFKTTAKASISATIISSIVGLSMAYSGYGVWAILISGLVSSVIRSMILWYNSKWRPKLMFSFKSIKELFSFGSKLLASAILDTIYSNVYQLVIGKVYSASTLGHYTRAKGFAALPSSNLTSIMQRVTYPMLCTIQDDNDRLASVYRRLLKLSAFVIFPCMVGLSALAKPLILTLLNEQWMFTITLLHIVCFSMMWYPIHSINLNLLKVKGRSDLFLKLEIWKKIVGITILSISVPLGIVAMCVGSIISSLICLGINTYYTGKLINIGYFRQMRDLTPTLILSLVMGVIVYVTVSLLNLPNIILLLLGVVEGALIYIVGAKLFRFSEFEEALELLHRNKNNDQHVEY